MYYSNDDGTWTRRLFPRDPPYHARAGVRVCLSGSRVGCNVTPSDGYKGCCAICGKTFTCMQTNPARANRNVRDVIAREHRIDWFELLRENRFDGRYNSYKRAMSSRKYVFVKQVQTRVLTDFSFSAVIPSSAINDFFDNTWCTISFILTVVRVQTLDIRRRNRDVTTAAGATIKHATHRGMI